jgi:hypothetical protein
MACSPFCLPKRFALLWEIVTPAATVQKILPVAQGALGVLINRDDDGLDVLVAPTFPAGQMPDLRQRVDPGRVVLGVRVVPLWRFVHYQSDRRALWV